MSDIRVESLSHVYSQGTPFEKVAVDHIDLEIPSGQYVGVIGHTGSGKSTFIQHLNGLLKPSEGRVLLDGEDIFATKEKTRDTRFRVGLVFQYPEYQLFEETVRRDIAYGPKNMGCSEEEIRVQIRKVLLHEFRHHLESLAGERDLEIEDAVNVSQYKAKKRQEKT